MPSHDEVIYSADPDVMRLGETLRAMGRGMLRSHYLAYRLMKKAVKSGYSKSAFGMLWDLADPLVLGCIFYLLMKGRVIVPGEMTTPYPVFVIYGLMIYTTFCQALQGSVDLIRGSKGILNQLKVPPEALIQAVFLRVLFDSFFRIVVMLLFSLILMQSAEAQGLHAFSLLGFLKFLLAYPFMVMAGMGVGLLLAPFNVLYNDVGRLVKIILTPLRYVTPVLWPIPSEGRFFSLLNVANPVTPIINGLRDLATANVSPDWKQTAAWMAGYTVVFFLGWFLFHVSVPVLAEKA